MIEFKKVALALVAASTVATAAPAAAAVLPQAHVATSVNVATASLEGESWEHGRDRRDWRNDRYYGRGNDRGYYRGNGRGYYDDRGYRNASTWRGNDGRYYCRRSDGTTGLLIGGAAGALIGREVAGHRGDRTLGAILGAGAGALLGREVDRGGSRCR
ncbi:glycine zipper 2TM domain-containing protein [Novosphingobium sp. SL115]|uniref:glycine zipper 2TM domain-containing protein n=1 Tax=Novosphingobium sp. SL115 TaxID=2995150 RepID=UPI002272A041|nr:glycine zipper 2TM domain-containing protein [Novosphingobium sp. SL115]MCY1671135.1 glycine zipper 2TM domain-containing protein [Novosphingobium sp. SL115]